MILLGLTGSIAMGKSRAAAAFRALGTPVFDSDAAVHALMLPQGAAAAAIALTFPGCGSDEAGIDRKALGARVLGDAHALARLERILHPAVRAAQGRFLRRAARAGVPLVVLDIPLLFETGGEARVDRVAVVSAGAVLQRERALKRPGMTAARLGAILGRQVPDAEKRRRADFVIPSHADRGGVIAHAGAVIEALRPLPPSAWPQRWLAHHHLGGRP